MHACFHGGGGNSSRITKSVGFIAKSMKAMSLLKVKTTGDGEGDGHPRRRRRRHQRRSPEAAEELQDKDVAAASSSASSSAKIAPAQPHEAADGDRRKDRLHLDEEQGQGGAKHEHCDKCCSPLDDDDGAGDAEAAAGTADAASDGEWAAEPEPGVLMTLVSRGDGSNYLRRIRFSEEYFGDAWAAQTWWADNCDRIVELYSVVVQPEHHSQDGDDDDDPAVPVTPCQSEDDEHQLQDGIGNLDYSASCSASASGGSTSNFSGPSSGSGSGSANKVDSPILGLVTEADSITRTARAEHSHKAMGQEQ
ncbi:putative protein Brevis radix-like 5 [Miscanthus floridulus]|uniref:putative protein Brevis radix-like 5 n=1 Tax=Miscanthus floridulus TaxID=154761 RepID=UPI00345B112B